ncbi:apolipoprotein L3-like [Carassius gibelio]|uniref:apolipoprotein L3-like n=1 Tax=Carassius gibelio TaxID=101364 RepID=UPI0022775A1E|nr:apolipoprotein L3-like [Carassius gibelio]
MCCLWKFEALSGTLQQSIKGLNSEFDKKHSGLVRNIKELNDITDELESVHKNTTVGSLVGSTLGATGGITALVGLALAPFTFGGSLAVSAIGAVVGISGGVTGAACNITNMIKQKNLRETIMKIVEDFQNTLNPIIKHLSTISNTIEELQQVEQMFSVENKAIMTSVRSVKTISSITKLLTILKTAEIGRTAAKAATVLKMVGKISGTVSALFLVLDVVGIVYDSIEISEMNQPAQKRNAEEIKSETLKFIHKMRETAAQFQETLDAIKSARENINRELQICF